jgi:rhodanese-related sulfurtransferase
MAKNHATRFLAIVDAARSQVAECTVQDVKARMDAGEEFHLVDVREESEFAAGRIPTAIHLGKGVIERDVESKIPDTAAPIVLYCGGGYRSALAALNLVQMGYENVISMDGGVRGWKGAGYDFESNG